MEAQPAPSFLRVSGRGFGRRLALAAATLLLAELVAQAYYRATTGDVLARRGALPIFEADPVRCYRLRPGLAYQHRTPEFSVTLYTNSQGMRTGRDRTPIGERKPGVFRILFLGTSYAFGWGSEYEESYAALIGAGLTQRGRPAEVVNLGTPAQPGGHQLCWLRTEGRRLRPDLVVQTVFTNASVLATSCDEERVCPAVQEGYLVRSSPGPRAMTEASKRSALVFYAWYLRHRYMAAPAAGDASREDAPQLGLRAQERPPALRARHERFVRSVREAVGQPVGIVVVLIPPSFVVHPGDTPRWGPVGVQGEEIRAGTRAAAQALDAHGTPFIDATPALQAASGTGRMFYWLDTHLTPAGNRVVADLVLSRLSGVAAYPPPSPER